MKLSDIALYYPHDVRAAFQMYKCLSGEIQPVPAINVMNEKEITDLAKAEKLDAAFISLSSYAEFPDQFSILETGTVFSPTEDLIRVEGSTSENVRAAAWRILAHNEVDLVEMNETGTTVGAAWLTQFEHRLPEALFCIHRRFPDPMKKELEAAIRLSRVAALKFKQRALQYAVNFSEIFDHAATERFCKQNFDSETEQLSEKGKDGIQFFLSRVRM